LLLEGPRAFFSRGLRKILFSKNLSGGVSHHSSQNLEPLRLKRKTLLNKHLAAARRRRSSPLGIRMMGYFSYGAQGHMSQGFTLVLWKFAE
jgi:hypothetical protein